MSRVMVHVSINIRKALMDILRENLKEFNKTYREDVVIETASNDEAENWFIQSLEQGSLPQLAIAHATDFVPVSKEILKNSFLSLPGKYPLRNELKSKGLEDPEGIFHPFALIPFVIVGNTGLLHREEMPVSWQDLLNYGKHRQVVFPEANSPITQVVTAILKNWHPDKFKEFYPLINFDHSPVETLKAVGGGQFALGIANLGFSKMMTRDIVPILPEEGALCSPLVLVCSKEAGPHLLEFANILFSKRVQEMLAQQGFIPASPDVVMPKDNRDQVMPFFWDSWGQYYKILRKGPAIS